MAKTKTVKKTSKVEPVQNGQPSTFAPWVVPELVRERVWTYLPAYFEAIKTLYEEQQKTNALLTEIRDSLAGDLAEQVRTNLIGSKRKE